MSILHLNIHMRLFGSQPLPLPLSHQVVVTGFRAKFNRKVQNPSGKHPPCRCLVPSPGPRLMQGGLFPRLPHRASLLTCSSCAPSPFSPFSFLTRACSKSPAKSSNTDYFSMQMKLFSQGKRKNVDHVRDAQKIAPPTQGSPVNFSLTWFPNVLM